MRSGELFAGVGGLGMAVDRVFGSRPSWFCEFDAAPSKVLAYHHPDAPNFGDVTKVDWVAAPRVQILAGGFPCQDVSLAGRRRGMGEGTRSGLWSEYAKAIDEIRPDWVVIENVRGLLSADANSNMEPCPLCVGDDPRHVLRALGAVLGDLAELGFDAEWTGIRASDIGAPHGRFRVFILAWPRGRTSHSRVPLWEGESGSGHRPGRGTPDLTLLPTPDAYAGERGGAQHPDKRRSGGHTVSLSDVAEFTLLPTPVAQPSGNTPEEHLRKKPGREVVTDLAIIAENGLIETGGRLLPTPKASDGDFATPSTSGRPSHNATFLSTRVVKGGEIDFGTSPTAGAWGHACPTCGDGEDMHDADGFCAGLCGGRCTDPELGRPARALLPTPTASEGEKGGPNQAYGSGGSTLSGAVPHLTGWGPYEAAIRRWEAVIGRPAPAPVRFDGKGGKPRLNPELTEWMMGWPAGHVTAPAIGLTRAEQLKACGNGVVYQQAEAAIREMLARPGVPSLEVSA